MTMMTSKCPTCGALSQVSRESASAVTECPKCGAMYVPEECEASAAAMALESAARAERLARQSEEHLRRMADDLHYITQYLKGARMAGWTVGAVVALALLALFLRFIF